MFAGVEGLGDRLKVNEAGSEVKVRVYDGPRGVVGCDEVARDVVQSFQAPQHMNVGILALPRLENVP